MGGRNADKYIDESVRNPNNIPFAARNERSAYKAEHQRPCIDKSTGTEINTKWSVTNMFHPSCIRDIYSNC